MTPTVKPQRHVTRRERVVVEYELRTGIAVLDPAEAYMLAALNVLYRRGRKTNAALTARLARYLRYLDSRRTA